MTLGLDPSWTGYGVALYDPATGEHLTKVIRTKGSKGVPIAYRRTLELQQKVEAAVMEFCVAWSINLSHITHICLEDFARGTRNGREEAGMNRAVTNMALGSLFGDVKVAYPTLVATTALKKYVMGSGRGEKSDMKMVTYKKWGVEFKNDNECDAYGLARIAAALDSTVDVDLAYEREVLANLGRHGGWEPLPVG